MKALKIDWGMFLPIFLLSILGVTLQFSVARETYFNHLVYATLSIFLFVLVSNIDYRIPMAFYVPGYVFSVILLAVTYFLGVMSRGATRWLDIGNFRFQPSELTKPLLLVFFSMMGPRIVFLILGFIPIGLIFFQPDLGTALVVGAGFVGILSRWIPIKYWFLGLIAAAIITVPIYKYVLHDYQKGRLMTFINPYSDPLDNGYHVIQSTIAFGSGGFLGKGLGHGTQSQLRFLPEHHTDFIFASLGEELGAIGALLVVTLYSILLVRIHKILNSCTDEASTLFCLGIFVMLIFQIAVNIGMNIGIAPVTGITLPFLSYGGSSMLSISVCLGLVAAMRK